MLQNLFLYYRTQILALVTWESPFKKIKKTPNKTLKKPSTEFAIVTPTNLEVGKWDAQPCIPAALQKPPF